MSFTFLAAQNTVQVTAITEHIQRLYSDHGARTIRDTSGLVDLFGERGAYTLATSSREVCESRGRIPAESGQLDRVYHLVVVAGGHVRHQLQRSSVHGEPQRESTSPLQYILLGRRSRCSRCSSHA